MCKHRFWFGIGSFLLVLSSFPSLLVSHLFVTIQIELFCIYAAINFRLDVGIA